MHYASGVSPQAGLSIDFMHIAPALAIWALALIFMLNKMRPGFAHRLSLVFWSMIALAGGTLLLTYLGVMPEITARSPDYGSYALTRSVAAAGLLYFSSAVMPVLGTGFCLFWVIHMVLGWFRRPHADCSLAPTAAGGREF